MGFGHAYCTATLCLVDVCSLIPGAPLCGICSCFAKLPLALLQSRPLIFLLARAGAACAMSLQARSRRAAPPAKTAPSLGARHAAWQPVLPQEQGVLCDVAKAALVCYVPPSLQEQSQVALLLGRQTAASRRGRPLQPKRPFATSVEQVVPKQKLRGAERRGSQFAPF